MTADVNTDEMNAEPTEATQEEQAGATFPASREAVEALLMIADEPLPLVTIATALGVPIGQIETYLSEIAADFNGENGQKARGFELREVGGGWRLYVREEFDALIRDFVLTQNPSKLSQAALETLAVIAYKQPVSRGQVASIRAVNVDSVVRTLVSRGFVTEVGTEPDTGAVLYGTTELLLTQMGINSIEDLPKISPLLDDGANGFDLDA